MNKKITAVIAVTLFLVQAILLAGTVPAESLSPNPLTEINASGANLPFKDTCNFLCMALSLYRSDAFKGMSKEELVKVYSPILSGSDVRFDFAHIDLIRKGWTRYYPFSVGEKRFVARIFLTREASFQPVITPISELLVEDSGVTLQILPGINDLLADHKIKPIKIVSPSPADRHA